MANDVYANGREIACKKASGKAICAFPDVCFTPPQTPATPPGVPIPYPNTGMAKDTTKGSKKTKISGKEIMLKNQSHFKTSYGDEAGCAPKKGLITSKNKGKIYFTAWSMDVKVEGKNAVRHLDITTHNHSSNPPNSLPQIYADRMAMANIEGCEKQRQEVKDACDPVEEKECPDPQPLHDAKSNKDAALKAWKGGGEPKNGPLLQAREQRKADWNAAMDKFADEYVADDCRRRLRCLLSPYTPSKCCPGQTPHHLVEAGSFYDKGRERGWQQKVNKKTGAVTRWNQYSVFGADEYDEASAPCICAEGENQNQATHGLLHDAQDRAARAAPSVKNPNPFFNVTTAKGEPAKFRTLENSIESGAEAVGEVFPESKCDEECTKAQLRNFHYNQKNMNPELPVIAANGQGKPLPA